MPLQDGFWLPSLASVTSGFVTQSAVCSHSVHGNHLPKAWLILSYLPLPDVIDQLFFMLCTSHRLQASCTTPICVGFLSGFFLPAVTGSLHFSFLPTTRFQSSRGFHVTHTPLLKEIGQETQEEIQKRIHINDL